MFLDTLGKRRCVQVLTTL